MDAVTDDGDTDSLNDAVMLRHNRRSIADPTRSAVVANRHGRACVRVGP